MRCASTKTPWPSCARSSRRASRLPRSATALDADRGGVKGEKMTSWPSLHSDLKNAGAKWIDKEVVADGELVTSRKPDDIPAFNREMTKLFARVHEDAAY